MREITKKMIEYYKIMKLGYDFMGYPALKKNTLSFHHLIVPRRNCKAMNLGTLFVFLVKELMSCTLK